jgi:hypothetical protein
MGARMNGMRTFHVHRDEDESGVSGTGVIAEGVLFSNGKVVVSWLSMHKIIECADSVAEWQAVHGHEGRTRVVWDDEIPNGNAGEKKKTVLDDD